MIFCSKSRVFILLFFPYFAMFLKVKWHVKSSGPHHMCFPQLPWQRLGKETNRRRMMSYKVGSLSPPAPLIWADGFYFNTIGFCVYSQTSHCLDRALNPRQLKTFWTNTGILRGQAPAMELRQERPMTAQEVREENSHKCNLRPQNPFHADFSFSSFFNVCTDICVEDSDCPREDALQNNSADDLLDSASQSAQQHDSKFSFRCLRLHNQQKFLVKFLPKTNGKTVIS